MSDSNYKLSFLHGLPVVGRVTRTSKAWVEDHPDFVSLALTAGVAYGLYRGLKYLYKKSSFAQKLAGRTQAGSQQPQDMQDFAEEYDLEGPGNNLAGIPLEEVEVKQRNRAAKIQVETSEELLDATGEGDVVAPGDDGVSVSDEPFDDDDYN